MIKFNLYLALECKKKLTPEVSLEGQPLPEFVVFSVGCTQRAKIKWPEFETLQDEVFTSSMRQQKDVGSIFGKYERSYQSPPLFPVHYKRCQLINRES